MLFRVGISVPPNLRNDLVFIHRLVPLKSVSVDFSHFCGATVVQNGQEKQVLRFPSSSRFARGDRENVEVLGNGRVSANIRNQKWLNPTLRDSRLIRSETNPRHAVPVTCALPQISGDCHTPNTSRLPNDHGSDEHTCRAGQIHPPMRQVRSATFPRCPAREATDHVPQYLPDVDTIPWQIATPWRSSAHAADAAKPSFASAHLSIPT
jgi:hypothetical protein